MRYSNAKLIFFFDYIQVVIQYDKDLLEVWDEAKRLRCEWFNDYEKTASKPPMVIADLDVIQLDFRGKYSNIEEHFPSLNMLDIPKGHVLFESNVRIEINCVYFSLPKVTMSIAGWKYKVEKVRGHHLLAVSYLSAQHLHLLLLSMIIEVSWRSTNKRFMFDIKILKSFHENISRARKC